MGASGAGHWEATAWQLVGYKTYGPYVWALRRISDSVNGSSASPGLLADSFFYDYLRGLADIKLGYMFAYNGLRQMHEPN